jgi:hypothetical protein
MVTSSMIMPGSKVTTSRNIQPQKVTNNRNVRSFAMKIPSAYLMSLAWEKEVAISKILPPTILSRKRKVRHIGISILSLLTVPTQKNKEFYDQGKFWDQGGAWKADDFLGGKPIVFKDDATWKINGMGGGKVELNTDRGAVITISRKDGEYMTVDVIDDNTVELMAQKSMKGQKWTLTRGSAEETTAEETVRAMMDLDYKHRQQSQWDSSWANPRLDSKKASANDKASRAADERFWVQVDFAGNEHEVREIILMKRGDGNTKRHIS